MYKNYEEITPNYIHTTFSTIFMYIYLYSITIEQKAALNEH